MEENIAILNGEKNYREDLQKVEKLYILTLVLCGAVLAVAIVWAVLDSILMGIILAICSVVVYMALAANLLYRFFGISYKSFTGRMTVTQLYGKNREEIWIPERIIMLDVTDIGDRAFGHRSSERICAVHLPASLLRIGENIFDGCSSLKTVYFDGSREEWDRIEKNTDFSAYEIVFLTENAKEDSAQAKKEEDV